MNNSGKYLPIGTIVRLTNGKKNVMIMGFCPIANGNQALYDYCACLYPEGVISPDFNLLFNHEQIEEIISLGYSNEEETAFKVKLNENIAAKQAKGELPPKGVVGAANNNVANTSLQPQMFGGSQNPQSNM